MRETAPEPAGDESEIEISGYDSSGWRRWSRSWLGQDTPKRARRARLRVTALVVLVSLSLVAVGVPDLRAALAARVATALGTRQPTPSTAIKGTPVAAMSMAPPIPLVSAPPLANAPQTCAAAPLATAQVPFYGAGLGHTPVFVIGLSTPHPTLRLGGVTGQTYTAYGWPALLTWALAPGYNGTATLRVVNLADGQPIPITAGWRHAPAASVILDPNDPRAPPQLSHWALWAGTIYLPSAGCYALEASWPGGSWALPFAAGR